MSSETSLVAVEADLDATFAAYVAAGHAPGLVYGLTTADGLVHAAGFGTADVRVPDAGTPDARTRFPIASMSKSFAAATVLACRDRGLLSLDDPITRWVGELRADEPPTLRHLLSMSGGLTEDNSWIDPQIDLGEADLLARVARGVRFSAPPGVAYEYANLGYALVQVAVQRAAGAPFAQVVDELLLRPLALTGTSFDPAHGPAPAAGHTLDDAGAWQPLPTVTARSFAAAGGMVSTVTDLARWVTWLGAAFRPDHGGPLSPAARRELQRTHTVIPPALVHQREGTLALQVGGYGLGVVVEQDLRHGVVVAHSGGLPGYKLHMRWHPDSGYGLVVATNSHRGDPVTLAVRAFARLLDARRVPARRVTPWPETVAARRAVEGLLRSWDDDVAGRLFAENVAVDRPLARRRAQVQALVEQVGPLRPPLPDDDVVSLASPADLTWAVPGEHGELICQVHLTAVAPFAVQELVVTARPAGVPRSAAPTDVSDRRGGRPALSALDHVGLVG